MATLAPALVQLRGEVNAVWPDRSKVSDGWVADDRHLAAGTSDHIPDAAGVVHAIDVTAWQAVGQTLTGRLRTARDNRLKYVIFRGQMFSSYPARGVPAWTWRPYDGENGHFHHVHVSVYADHRADDRSSWGLQPVPDLKLSPADPDPLEDLVARMTDDDYQELMRAVRCFNRTFDVQQKSKADGKTLMWLSDTLWFGDAHLKRAADALVQLAGKLAP